MYCTGRTAKHKCHMQSSYIQYNSLSGPRTPPSALRLRLPDLATGARAQPRHIRWKHRELHAGAELDVPVPRAGIPIEKTAFHSVVLCIRFERVQSDSGTPAVILCLVPCFSAI